SHNKQNGATTIESSSLTFDNNGNTKNDTTNTYTYDAWNRIATTTKSSKTYAYAYDALGRRIIEGSAPGSFGGGGGSVGDTDLYYSAAWQVVEEDTTYANGTVDENGNDLTITNVENVWSPAYIDALVERAVNVSYASS